MRSSRSAGLPVVSGHRYDFYEPFRSSGRVARGSLPRNCPCATDWARPLCPELKSRGHFSRSQIGSLLPCQTSSPFWDRTARDRLREPVEKLKRREVNDAVRPRSRGLPAAAGSDPVGVNSVPFDIVIGKDGRLFSNSIGNIDAALVAESVQSEDDGRTKR